MSKQFILIVYDISVDKRRTKLHDALLDFGTPVQYSVFVCLLEAPEVVKLKGKVKRIIRPKTDNVRYYYLCQDCLGKAETTCGVEVLKDDPQAVVV